VSGTRGIRLGYPSLTWGEAPDLDEMLAAIAGAGWEDVEFIGVSSDWLAGNTAPTTSSSTVTSCRRSPCSAR
jgi:hypothetical protein